MPAALRIGPWPPDPARRIHIEDERARWLGWHDANHFLKRGIAHLEQRRIPEAWVWRHYQMIFQGRRLWRR